MPTEFLNFLTKYFNCARCISIFGRTSRNRFMQISSILHNQKTCSPNSTDTKSCAEPLRALWYSCSGVTGTVREQ